MLDNTSILQTLQNDYENSAAVHETIMEQVRVWWDLYDGAPKFTKPQGSKDLTRNSNLPPQKDIMRVVESSVPDITSSFITSDNLVEIQPKSGDSVVAAEVLTKLINQQFRKGINKIEFVETIARNLQVEATCFVKVGWGIDSPIVENVPIGEVMIDPSARTLRDAKFVIQRKRVSRNELESNPQWYGSVEGIQLESNDINFEHSERTVDNNFNFDDEERELIEIFEYYGQLDLGNGNGLEPVLCIWTSDTLLKAEPSPYPESWGGIPFESTIYTRIPYSIYGDSVCSLLSGSQNFRQLIRSGLVENITSATNGTTYFKTGALSLMNKKNVMNGKRYVELNGHPSEVMSQGNFNEINPAVFNLNSELRQEQDDMSGVSRFNTSSDPRALNSGVSATAITAAQSNGQKRLLQISRHISEMLERIFTKWIDLNQELLQEATIVDGDDYIPINGGMLRGSFDVNVIVGTSGLKESKIQNIQMMLSMLGGSVPPNVQMALLAEMSSLMEMPKLAEELTKLGQQPQNNPEADMAMQLKAAEAQATIEKDAAQAAKYRAEAMGEHIDTELKTYGL